MDRSGGDAAVIFMPGIVCQGDKRLTWAKYAVDYTEVAGSAKTASITYSRTKKAASAYTIQNGVFVLKSPTTKTIENLAAGDCIVNISTSNNTATSGSTLYKVTKNAERPWIMSSRDITSDYAGQSSFYGYSGHEYRSDGTYLLKGNKLSYSINNNSNFSLRSNVPTFGTSGLTTGPHETIYYVSYDNGKLTVQEWSASKDSQATITYTPYTLSGAKGEYIGEVKANEGTYPDNGIKNGYWYVLLN